MTTSQKLSQTLHVEFFLRKVQKKGAASITTINQNVEQIEYAPSHFFEATCHMPARKFFNFKINFFLSTIELI